MFVSCDHLQEEIHFRDYRIKILNKYSNQCCVRRKPWTWPSTCNRMQTTNFKMKKNKWIFADIRHGAVFQLGGSPRASNSSSYGIRHVMKCYRGTLKWKPVFWQFCIWMDGQRDTQTEGQTDRTDGWIDRQLNRQIDWNGWMDRQTERMDGWMDWQTAKQTDRLIGMDGWTDRRSGRMGGWIDRQLNRQTDWLGWMDGWMHGWTDS
jgi:hypothetical protein